MKFTASQFTPTKWESAEQKAKFANHFIRFVKSGFQRSLFYKWFYRRLSNTFGHIAHYDQHGFFSTFFEDTESKIRFIEITLNHPCYGEAEWTYSDAERALQPEIREMRILEELQSEEARETDQSDRAEYERLKVKYADG